MDKTVNERMKRYRNKQKELEVKKIAENEGTRLRMVRNNHKIPDVCEVCGHKGVTDIHHEGEAKVIHYLCPNCHAQLTRGKITLEELIAVTSSTVTGESVTVIPTEPTQVDVTVHPLMIALSDIRIRAKLRRVCEELHKSRQLHNVLYGTRHPVSFDVVAEYLTALS